ncbi:DNA translocase FtsK [Tabrizicola fusiformis]|uniref:DNA translocase FtsK n=1 Tax=Tabrizicola sp. SY72 TaxID=2741673 RepID=UPI001572B3D5|nr:DNA translocase FtsK [Tabrizicola sp. SY72]NTT84559.1 DNA translocase FtsK 4TM domain-containing protein [Tabrizicola sp. SY72]
MASYQVRQRDPLLDQNTQAMLERRGRELLGLLLIGLALAFTAMLWSYSPEDPGWMVASDKPVANALGSFGAALTSTLIIIGGKGAWGIPMILCAWGLRFVLHRGAERAVGRVVFAVIAIAMASVYCATLVPGADWVHSFGLGGLFGDTVSGALVGMVPGGAGFGLKLISAATGLTLVVLMLYVMGFDLAEMRALLAFLVTSLIYSYSILLGAAGKGAQGTVRAASAMQERRRAAAPPMAEAGPRGLVRRAPPVVAEEADLIDPAPLRPAPLRADPRYAEPLAEAPQYAPPREKVGLLARMPALMRRVMEPEPELVEPMTQEIDDLDLPDDDRIKARISDAVRSRTRTPEAALNPITAAIQRREPAMSRPRGPQPLIADTRRPAPAPVAPPGLRAEPPVVARPAAVASAALTHLARAVPPAQPPRPAAPVNAFVHIDEDDLPEDDLPRTEDEAADDWQPDGDFEPDYDPTPVTPRALPVVEVKRGVVQQPAKKPALSTRAVQEAQPRLRFDDPAPAYELPPLSLLASPASIQRHTLSNEALEENARMLENVLDDYGVKGEIVSVRPGPVVTMYELEPAPGLKASRVIGLADDIARSMSALSARVSTVPGRTVIGIELPNAHREKVVLREILSARDFGDSQLRLPLALGKDIGGAPIVANLAKMPHLLIAGTTGSGKSVAINTMILSLLYKLTPEECRLIMIDPKMLELSVYDGIPHLLSPVVTDPKKAVVALKWVVSEMEDRYRKMSKMGVRNIEGHNGRVREALAKGEMFKRTIQTGFDEDTGEPVFETDEYAPVSLPYIVVIVDEMADLMMVAGKEIEACIQRLAQMARASGIHLIMATQRPSVDVITGTIKANFPTRISFQVTSKIDSRTILGEQGAEQLLGMGDMLYMAGGGRVSRIHGPFVSDEEVEEIVNHLKSFGPPSYMSGVVEGPDEDSASDIDMVLGLGSGEGGDDALYDQAVAIVAKDRKCSTSYIQRKLGIGYNKAARLVEQMEEQGVVTPANHVGKREILIEER